MKGVADKNIYYLFFVHSGTGLTPIARSSATYRKITDNNRSCTSLAPLRSTAPAAPGSSLNSTQKEALSPDMKNCWGKDLIL
jgi:hypothetical protein